MTAFGAALFGLNALWQLEFIVGLVLKATLLVAVAGAIAALLHRRTAVMPDGMITLALVTLILVPVVSVSLPQRRIDVPLPNALRHVDNPVKVEGLRRDLVVRMLGERATANMTTAGGPSADHARGPGISTWLVPAWLLVACVLLIRYSGGLVRLRRLRTGARPAPAAVQAIATHTARELGLARMPRVILSEAFAVPVTYGMRKPIVIVPHALAYQDRDALRLVLAHELTHIRRDDWIRQLIARLACCMFWFHPGVWWLARAQQVSAELNCDRAVLDWGAPRAQYARLLLHFGSVQASAPTLALPFARATHVEARIRRVLGPAPEHAPSRATAWLGTILLLALLPALLVAAPRAAEGCGSGKIHVTASPQAQDFFSLQVPMD